MGTPVCKTCGEPYRKHKKGVVDRSSFCSSNFHCCKDCKWKCEDIHGFCGMKLIEWCDGCKEAFPEGYAQWLEK